MQQQDHRKKVKLRLFNLFWMVILTIWLRIDCFLFCVVFLFSCLKIFFFGKIRKTSFLNYMKKFMNN